MGDLGADASLRLGSLHGPQKYVEKQPKAIKQSLNGQSSTHFWGPGMGFSDWIFLGSIAQYEGSEGC